MRSKVKGTGGRKWVNPSGLAPGTWGFKGVKTRRKQWPCEGRISEGSDGE